MEPQVLTWFLTIPSTGKRFTITPRQLEEIRDNPGLYRKLNGIGGIAAKLDVRSIDQGINGSDVDIKERTKEFGSNTYEEEPPRGFLLYVKSSIYIAHS